MVCDQVASRLQTSSRTCSRAGSLAAYSAMEFDLKHVTLITGNLRDIHNTLSTTDRVQARCACLPLLAWYGSVIPCTRTAPCGGHGLATATSFRFDVRAEHSTNALCRVTVSDRAFGVAAARIRNSLPSDVTASPSLSVLKRPLKTSLFSRSFDF